MNAVEMERKALAEALAARSGHDMDKRVHVFKPENYVNVDMEPVGKAIADMKLSIESMKNLGPDMRPVADALEKLSIFLKDQNTQLVIQTDAIVSAMQRQEQLIEGLTESNQLLTQAIAVIVQQRKDRPTKMVVQHHDGKKTLIEIG